MIESTLMQESPSSESKSFLRQVRRYVHAPEHKMAAIIPRELASLCQNELYGLGIDEASVTEAGLEFRAKLTSCYLGNLWLRTASRVLCRIAHFRAGAVEELFRKATSLRWELWLSPDVPLRITPYIQNSRIEFSSLVGKTVLAAVRRRFAAVGRSLPNDCRSMPDTPKGDSTIVQRVLVRIVDNYCEISLDSSGEHLHRRGYRPWHAGAPVRETLAAAILMKAGWQSDVPILDGMCGAGTVPIEASLLARRLPPGLNRHFLFEDWPGFKQETWNHLLRKAREESFSKCPVPVIALDRDARALNAARHNAELAGVSGDIFWQQSDFFSFDPRTMNVRPGLLFLNPPYGKRLPETDNSFDTLGSHLRRFYRGWRLAIMAPDRSHALRLRIGSARYWRVRHGGMPIVVVLAQL